MRILPIFVLSTIMLFGQSYAGGGNNVSSLNSYWGGASMAYCLSHGIKDLNTDVCLGKARGCLENKPSSGTTSMNNGNWDQGVNTMWVATKVTQGGAQFCAVRIDARNNNKHDRPWTTYHRYDSSDDSCFWLCHDGYGGADCSDNDGDFVCNTTEFNKTITNKFKDKSAIATNVEDSIAMFEYNKYRHCSNDKSRVKEEHDRILAITRWSEDGHGAFVRQMVVRAASEHWVNMKTWPNIYPATNSKDILVCRTGYKPDLNYTKCIEVNATRCAEQNICSDFESGYNETMHKLQFDEGKECYKYTCAEEGKAFASAIDRTCIDCPENLHGGPGSNGTCLKCTDNQIYVGKDCAAAKRLTKTDLMYGIGKTRNSEKDVKEWCWTRSSIDEYGACINGVSVEQYKCTNSGGTWDGSACNDVSAEQYECTSTGGTWNGSGCQWGQVQLPL